MDQLIKPISVALIFVFIAACDLLKIVDPTLREALFAMIGIITGWHGINNLPIGIGKSVVAAPAPSESPQS